MSQPARPVRPAFQFWWPVTVRWGDMDALGHVNNVMYLQYLESARIGFFESKGWNGAEIGPTGQGPVAVVSQTFNYRRQLHYPAEVEVGVACPPPAMADPRGAVRPSTPGDRWIGDSAASESSTANLF